MRPGRGRLDIPSKLFGLSIRHESRAGPSRPGTLRLHLRNVPFIDLPRNSTPLSQPGTSQTIRWTRSRTTHRVYWGDRLSVQVGPGQAIRVDSVATAEPFLAEALNVALALYLSRRGFAVLHGGAIAVRRAVAVVMGPPGAGKSSLVLAMARRGHEAVSDEIVPLEERHGIVRCPGGNPWIKVSPRHLLPLERSSAYSTRESEVLLDLRTIGLRAAREIRRIGCFFFLESRFGDGALPYRFEGIPPEDSLVRSLESAYTRRVLTDRQQSRQFRVLAEAVRAVPSYRLAVREGLENLNATAQEIETLVSGTVPSTD